MNDKATGFNMKFIGQAKQYLKTDKGRRMIIIVGIAGMALILLSSILPRQPSEQKQSQKVQTADNARYEQILEQRLVKLISGIEGAGKTTVLVTLENGAENIYAVNTDSDSNISEEWSQDSILKKQDNSGSKKDIVIVKKDGDETPVVTTTVEPRVKGVVVVCQGGDIATVQSKISAAVTTALNISSDRVCVIKSG